MDPILDDLTGGDFKRKLGGIAKLKEYLGKHTVKPSSWGGIVSVLLDVMRDNNFKLGLGAMECTSLLVGQMDSSGKHYVDSILPPLVKRMGDSKLRVRTRAADLALELMSLTDPAAVMDRLNAASKHKSARVREQYLRCLMGTVQTYGPDAISLPLLLPRVISLLSDGQAAVRDAALEAVVVAHAADPQAVSAQLERSSVRPSQLKALEQRFASGGAPGATAAHAHARTAPSRSSAAPGGSSPPGRGHGRSSRRGTGRGGGDERAATSGAPRHGAPRPATASATSSLHGHSHSGGGYNGDDHHSVASSTSSQGSRRRTRGRPASAGASHSHRRTGSGSLGGSRELMLSGGVDLEGVEPVSVYSERELAHEVEAVERVLGSTAKEWDERIKALTRLRGLLAGGAAEFSAFRSLTRRLREPLMAQASDLRSAVAKVACAAISELALTLGHDFEPHASPFVQCLLRLTIVTIQVISVSGDRCIQTILQCTTQGFPRVIPTLLDPIGGRNSVLRSHCMLYLLQTLLQWDTHTFDKHAAAVHRAISKGLHDAEGSVRSCARQAFWAFAQHFPDRATRIMESVDPSAQRLLHQDEHKVGTVAAHGGTPFGDDATEELDGAQAGSFDQADSGEDDVGRGAVDAPASRARFHTQRGGGYARTTGAAPAAASSPHKGRSPKHSPIKPDQGYADRWDAAGAQEDVDADDGYGRGHGHGRGDGHGRGVSASSGRGSSAQGHAMGRASRRVQRGGSGGGGGASGGGEVPGHSGARLGGAVRVQHGRHGSGGSSGGLTGAGNGHSSGYGRLASTAPAAVAAPRGGGDEHPAALSHGTFDSPGGADVQPGGWVGRAPASTHVTSPELHPVAPRRVQEAAAAAAAADEEEAALADAPLNHVLDDCSVEQWSDRVAAVNALGSMCRGGRRRAELLARVDAVVRVLLDRVADAHYKVTQAALQVLGCFVEVMRGAMEPHLQWILPEALSQLTAVKRAVRDAATELVDMIRRCYLGSQLAPLAIRVLDTPSTAARVGALDLLVHLLSQPDVVAHFYNAARMRTFVHKLAGVLTSKLRDPRGAARRVAASCLVPLHSAHSAGFLAAVASCTPSEQAAIVHACAPRVPDIGEQVALYLRSAGAGVHTGVWDGEEAADGGGEFSGRGEGQAHGDHRDQAGNGYGASLPQPPAAQRHAHAAAPAPPSVPATRDGKVMHADSERSHGSTLGGVVLPGVGAGPGSFSDRMTGYSIGAKYNDVYTNDSPQLAASNGHTRGSGRGGGQSRPGGSGGVRDSTDASSEVSGLLALLAPRQDPATKRAALHQIGVLAAQNSLALRPPFFGQVLAVILETLKSDEPVVLLAALPVLRRLLRHQGTHFGDFVELVVARLLDCTRSSDREVMHASERTLDLLVTVVEPSRSLQVLLPVVGSEDGRVLQSAIHMLGRVVTRLPSQELRQRLPHILPGLLAAFSSPKADVRKACVFCLVDMYMSIGDELFAHLTALTQSQLKLVTIYINRTLKSRGAATANAPQASSKA